MTQVKPEPMHIPDEPFHVANGPLPAGIKVGNCPGGVSVEIPNSVCHLPSTMAVELAKRILDAALGDIHK